jgi:membrane protease YdiL (CAAX protease family)
MGFFKARNTGGFRAIPDFIWWNFLFVLLTFIHYLTKTKDTPLEGTVTFFFYIWVGALLGLLFIQYAMKRAVIRYDLNISNTMIDKLFLGILLVEVSALVVQMVAQGMITVQFMAMYVPEFSLQSGPDGALSWRFYDDILFNIGPVATAEELFKALFIIILYNRYGKTPKGQAFAVLAPIGMWALLHGYQSYVAFGPNVMWMMIGGAFLSGLVLFYVWRKTENILIAILVHAAHNSLVILAPVVKILIFGA